MLWENKSILRSGWRGTHLNIIRMYVTWSISFSCTYSNSSSVADMNNRLVRGCQWFYGVALEYECTQRLLEAKHKAGHKHPLWRRMGSRTKGGRWRNARAAAAFPLLSLLLYEDRNPGLGAPSARVRSLWSSSSTPSREYFGTKKQISITRAKPASMRVWPNVAWTWKVR